MHKFLAVIAMSLALLCHFASAQTINWQKKFSAPSSGTAIQTLADGGYILAGGYFVGSVVRTNAQGDSLWSRSYGGGTNSFYFQSVAIVAGGYIVAGSKNAHPYAMKIDTNGNTMWEQNVGGLSSYGVINALAVVADGIVFTGYGYAGSTTSLFLAKNSLNGDSLWKKTLAPHTSTSGTVITGSSGNSIISSGSGYVVSGTADTEIYLVKFDASGNILWDRNYGGIHSKADVDAGNSVQPTADGGYIVCGGKALTASSFDTQIILLKTSSDGTQTWQFGIPGAGGFGSQVLVATDGYIVVGKSGGNRTVGHFIKTDLQGTVLFNQQLTSADAKGVARATNGSYTVVGMFDSAGGMYLGNISTQSAQRYFVLVDANNKPIPNKDIVLYKGTTQPGNDPRVAGRTTDSAGKIAIDPSWYQDGDNVRAVFIAAFIPTQKPLHQDTIIQGVAYRIMLDNVGFDESATLPKTAVRFEKYSSDPLVTSQRLTLNHTTVLFDLMISIEWNADKAFTDEVKRGMFLISNYLYDVFDGQVALGKVEISDDKKNWNGADVCITASTETWPHAGIQGYLNSNIGDGEQVMLPARWFGDPDYTRHNTPNPQWLSMVGEDTWRTLGHELGHQLIGFYDEYKDILGRELTDSVHPEYNLGYMDSQYSDTGMSYNTILDKVYASELSSPDRYRTYDKINCQYVVNHADCWTYFEQQFEKTYGGVFCPITKPPERTTLAAGAQYLLGPNDKAYTAAPYDASSMEKVTVFNADTSIAQHVMSLSIPGTPAPTPANLIHGYVKKKSSGRFIDCGLTNSQGKIRFLGSEKGDTCFFSGNVGGKKTGAAISTAAIMSRQKKGDIEIASVDSAILLSLVSGEYQVVPIAQLNGGATQVQLCVNKAFTQTPSAEVPLDNGPSEVAAFTFDAGRSTYSGQFDSLPSRGTMLTTAYDSAATPFVIPMSYSTSAIKRDIYGDNGGAWVMLDSVNFGLIQKVTIISSGFAPLRTGLQPDAAQGGNVHALVFHPAGASIMGNNALTIRYSDDELFGQSAVTLRIHKWNTNTSAWESIGGSVDTVHKEVNAKIISAGTYAAFTTSGSSGVIQHNDGVRDFTLSATVGNAGTTVLLGLAQQETITLNVYNSVGIQVGTLASGMMSEGEHVFHVNTTSLPSGMYFCTARTNFESKTVEVVVYR